MTAMNEGQGQVAPAMRIDCTASLEPRRALKVSGTGKCIIEALVFDEVHSVTAGAGTSKGASSV